MLWNGMRCTSAAPARSCPDTNRRRLRGPGPVVKWYDQFTTATDVRGRRSAIGRRAGAAVLTFTPGLPRLPLPRLRAEDVRIPAIPLAAVVDHRLRIDEAKREPVERRVDRPVRWHEVARQEQALALLAELELVPEQRRVRVRRARGDTDAVGTCDRRRDHVPVDRRSLVLQLLGLVVVYGQRDRHLARRDELRQQRVPLAH